MTESELKVCDRFKEVRNALDMKQGVFAKEIKTTQGHVSDIENKRKGVSDRVIEIICLKYDVNEDWLRYGTGEMFKPRTKSQEIFAFANDVMELDDNKFKKRFVEALTRLDKKDWEALEKIAEKLLKEG